MLASINGKIAFHDKESSSERAKNAFTCQRDFERMAKLVAQCDVVFHGASSIESEKGAFRVAALRKLQNEPEWIIFTRSGNISFQSPFWKQEGIPKSIFFVSSFNMQEKPILRVEEQEAPVGKITCYLGNMPGLIQHLKNKKYTKAALLGGGKLNTAFMQNNLIDELYLTLSPFIVGSSNAPSLFDFQENFTKRMILKNCESFDGFVYLNYLLSTKK